MAFSKILFKAVTAMVILSSYQASADAAEKPKLNDWILYDDVSMTGQFVADLSGDRPTKFQEYREVVTGPQAQNEILMLGTPGSSRYIYFEGFDIFRRDESILVEWGTLGNSKAGFEFNQIIHRYSENSRTIEQDPSTGNYVVDVGTRTTLAALATDAARAAQIRSLLSTFTERDLEIQRDKYNWNASTWVNEKFQMELKTNFEHREGLRKKGTGTYMRTGDTFEIRGIELPEPIEYDTLDMGARLTYAVPKSVTSLEWALSYFNNRADTLIWDNPFRITDSAANGGATGPTNRGNFVRGRVALYPSNLANTVTLSQASTLPYKTNFTGSISYGVNLQDDKFLPYTTNTALNGTGVGLAGFTVTDGSHLPKDSLNGVAHIFSTNVAIINHAIDRLKAKAYMNLYDYINSTRPTTFAGYAAFGDSFWLTSITNDSITNHPPSFLDLKTGIKLDYELTGKVSLNTGYEYKYRQLKNRQVPDIDEFILKNGIEVRPSSIVKIEGAYSVGFRRYRGEYFPHREFSELRMLDEADKDSNQVDMRVEVTPNEQLTLGASGMWRYDDYKTSYGADRTMALNLSFDSDYTPTDKWSVYTYYSFDQGLFDITSVAKSGIPYDVSNTWFSDISEVTNTLGAGTSYSFIPDRLILDLGYSFSLASQKISNSNRPNPANPITATGHEWPAVLSNWHEAKVQLKWKIHKNLDFKVYYNAEIYNLDDVAWDNLHPYLQGETTDNSTQYLWLDSRYSDYVAHVFGVALKYVF